jgi:UDP-glucuronate decarboxylase
MVKKVVNPKAELTWLENTADDPSRRKPDITKATTLLGYQPKIKLEEGLNMMVEDFRKRLHIDEENF